jgi:hypothetical protein
MHKPGVKIKTIDIEGDEPLERHSSEGNYDN